MATFVVVHGSWSGGWIWRKMRPLLSGAGHDPWTPTLTGLGERAHLASPSVDLETHVADVAGLLEWEDLRDVVLVGHSYAGMVVTGVADRAGSRVARLVYLDAFAPVDGESALDLASPDARDGIEAAARDAGEGWQVPLAPLPPDTPDADRAWAEPLRRPHPLAAYRTRLRLTRGAAPPERSYVRCTRTPPGDPFGPSAARARDGGWRYFELDTSHNPHVTAPGALAAVLDEIAQGAPR